jgi:hypothetical protein
MVKNCSQNEIEIKEAYPKMSLFIFAERRDTSASALGKFCGYFNKKIVVNELNRLTE